MSMRRMSRSLALSLGILTVWPALYIAWFLVSFFGFGSGFRLLDLPIVVPLHVGTIFLIFLLLAFYLVHAYRNERLTPERRLRWLVVLVFAHFVAMVVYWWVCVWKPREGP